MNLARIRLRAGLLAAAVVAGAAPARALPAEVKDPDFPQRSAAVKKAIRGLPEPVRQPMAPANENFLSPQQKGARAAEAEAESAAAVEAVRALSATRDARVFEELVRGSGVCGRMIPVADAALREATERAEKTRIPYFEANEREYRKTGKVPDTIRVDLGKNLDTLDWNQQEAAHALDYALRVRDAFVQGMGGNLDLLGADGNEAWKAAMKMGLDGKDPMDRAAFCEAVKSLERPEADGALLAIEAKEQDPVALSTALEALALRGSAEGFRRLVKRLDDPDPTVAVAAVRGVARYRSPETIPALAARLRKAEGRVYSDCIETLFAITGKHIPDQGAAWEGWWKKDGEAFLKRWSEDVAVRLEEIETIGLTDESLIDVPAELAALLPTERDAKARDAILENLSIHRSDFARITLLRALNDPSKPTRIAAIRGLAQYRHVAVPEELIRVVARADAEELQAIFQSLRTLWGGPTEFLVASADREKLLRWWDNSKDRVPEQFMKLGAQNIASGRKQSDSDETRWRDRNFYGLRVESDRVLFVVDVSLSMEEPAAKKSKTDPDPAPGTKVLRKIDVAKTELARVIKGLPDGTKFGLILFAIKPEIWPEGLVPMNNENRKRAVAWVEKLETHFATNIYDAMEAAFQIGGPNSPVKATAPPDTIFLVSDGAPTAGKFLKPDTIREHVRRWNKGRNVKVHVIGVGADHDVVFCRNLAEENGGFYIAR